MRRGVLLLLGLGACAGRPVPSAPLPLPPAADASPAIRPLSGPSQQLVIGASAERWWTSFGCPVLDALVDRALQANADIATADAALRQVQQLGLAANSSRLPSADLNYQAERAKVSNALQSPLIDQAQTLYTLHTTQLTVTYPVDLFGGVRTRIRSARAATEAASFRAQAARNTVVANLVLAVIQRAALIEQIAATEAAIGADRDVLTLLQRRQALGSVGAADVSAQVTLLAAVEATLPPLIRQQVHQEALIATLTGVAAGTALPPLPRLADLHLPARLPVALPADLVRRRPDARAAEAAMRGAAADVGTAIAARLPQIVLTGSVGGVATDFTRMFADGNPFWTIIGGITQPLFRAGALRHQQHAAEAALAGAQSQYRAVVLQAFVDVTDALTGLKADADALDAAARADAAAASSLRFATRALELGDVGTLAVRTASAARFQAAANLIQVQAARMSDTVALFQASGGGWS